MVVTVLANHPFETKTTYLIDLILSMSEKFTQSIFQHVEGIKNMPKSFDEAYTLSYPIIVAYTLAKALDYISQRFLENSKDAMNVVKKLSIKKLISKSNIDPTNISNDYAEKSENNEYMREMYIGDKLCKTIGGTFSNRDLIYEISLAYSEFFDKAFVGAMSKVWLMSGQD